MYNIMFEVSVFANGYSKWQIVCTIYHTYHITQWIFKVAMSTESHTALMGEWNQEKFGIGTVHWM